MKDNFKYQITSWNKVYTTSTLKNACIIAHDLSIEDATVVTISYVIENNTNADLLVLNELSNIVYSMNSYYNDFFHSVTN